jgi:hypothetical protein
MDIKQAKSVSSREDKGTVLHLKDECGVKMYDEADETKPVTITITGSYSVRAKRAMEAARDARTGRIGHLDGEEAFAFNLEVLAACILDWQGFTADGQPYPYTRDNAIALLRDVPWIREQVQMAHNDHALFSKAS